MLHKSLRRAAARRSVNLDNRQQMRRGGGAYVASALVTLRMRRWSKNDMTDSAYAYAYREFTSNRRATRQDVADEMRANEHPTLNARKMRARRIHSALAFPEIPARRRHRLLRAMEWNGIQRKQRFGPKSLGERMNRRTGAFDCTNRNSSRFGYDSEPLYVN